MPYFTRLRIGSRNTASTMRCLRGRNCRELEPHLSEALAGAIHLHPSGCSLVADKGSIEAREVVVALGPWSVSVDPERLGARST
jgi:hypothetical protein